MLKTLLSFLLPNYCPLCNQKTNSADLICKKCIPVKEKTEIKRELLPDAIIYSFFPYNENYQYILHQIKFEEKRFYISDLVNRINLNFLKNLNIELITYIPMPKSRLIQRGFNQSKIIAKETKKKINKRVFSIAGKRKYEKQSLRKTREEREEIIKNNPFYIKKQMVKKIKRLSSILIIDDLITTGSTMRAFINKIKDLNSNIKFYILTLFYTE